MRPQLQFALDLARTLPPDELPRMIGELAEISATAQARLLAPGEARPETLLDIEETAERMNLSRDYLYRHHKRLPFTRRVGRKLLFSSSGLELYLTKSR
jgi:excisionase family DNA binding protein